MSSQGASSRLPEPSRIVLSVGVGVAAFVVGYVLTFAVLILDGVFDGAGGSNEGSESPDQLFEFFGALFLNAHYLELNLDVDSELFPGPDTTNLIAELEFALPDLAYYAVPVVVVFGGGALAAWLVRDWLASPLGAGAIGASLVVCYLPLVALGTTVFSFGGTRFGTDYTISPPVAQSVLQAGLLYPIVLGGLGGLAYYRIRQSQQR